MPEKISIRQNRDFEISFEVSDPRNPESEELIFTTKLHDLDPYTMLLASLGSCTAIVLNTYARNHAINLEEVEIQLQYQRYFKDDCENCEEIEDYGEKIFQTLKFHGKLNEKDRNKLFQVSRYCSIHKMLEEGVQINSELITEE